MAEGIAIFGLNGGGKSTLAHALAQRMGYYEMDVEDYYFPEQKMSRMSALENCSIPVTNHLGDLPFSCPRTKGEVEAALLEDSKAHPRFILSGVTLHWTEDILSQIRVAFWVQTPLEERLKRIQQREIRRFGSRVLPGGDMYAQQADFRRTVEQRDSKAVEETARSLSCPVIVLDGTLPLTDNLARMEEQLGRSPERAS